MLIPKHWSPEQAWAVYELLNDLAQQIANHYHRPLQRLTEESPDDDPNTSQLDLFDSHQARPTEPLPPDPFPPF